MKIRKNTSKSFGILEVILVIAIFVVLIGGISIIAKRAVDGSIKAVDRQIALGYAQEGMEAVEQVYNTNGFGSFDVLLGSNTQTYVAAQNNTGQSLWSLIADPNIAPLTAMSAVDWSQTSFRLQPYLPTNLFQYSRAILIKKDTTSNAFPIYIVTCRVAWDSYATPTNPANYVELSTVFTN